MAGQEALPGRRIEANGLSLHVLDEGAGPAVLLLHGFPDSSLLWRHQIPALTGAGFRAVAPDLRGFGRSDKPQAVEDYAMPLLLSDVRGIMDALGIERAHVVGHDWGAVLAWMLASFEPERVERLVAISVGHPAALNRAPVGQLEKSWYIFLFQFAGVAEEALRRDDWRLLREWARGGGDIERSVEDLARPGGLTAALNWYRANVPPEILLADPLAYPPVRAPALGVWGASDPYLTERLMTGSAERVAGPWRYERFDDAGHWIPLEKPDRLNRLLVEFLTAAS